MKHVYQIIQNGENPVSQNESKWMQLTKINQKYRVASWPKCTKMNKINQN